MIYAIEWGDVGMLVNFSFSNYKSFRDAQQFSMERAPQALKEGAGPVSSVAGVFGANAAGKSSFLQAIQFLRRFVTDDPLTRDFLAKNLRPFLLDSTSKDNPTQFLIEFIGDDKKWYEFEVAIESFRITYETLRFREHGSRYSTLYRRELNEDGTETYRFWKGFRGPKKQLEKMTTKGRLFLATLHSFEVESVAPAFRFFERDLAYCAASAYEREFQSLARKMLAEPAYEQAVSKLMASADLGIQRIQAEDVPNALREQCGDERYTAFLASALAAMRPELSREDAAEQATQVASLEENAATLAFLHQGAGNKEVRFSMNDESDGTLAGLAFFSVAVRAVASGQTLLVDEIDTSLHPLFVRQLVELFGDPATNPTNAQLIFTTHDASLIINSGSSQSALAKDQIWLVEKDAAGSSELYSLAEVRGGRWVENYGRNYLNGVYGAAPAPNFRWAFLDLVELLRSPEQGEETPATEGV